MLYGTEIQVTAEAIEGYAITGWIINGNEFSDPTAFTLDRTAAYEVVTTSIARNDIKYTIRYLFEDVETGEFKQLEAYADIELQGTTGANISSEVVEQHTIEVSGYKVDLDP